MPEPIRTTKTQGIYGAPAGHEHEIGGLPFYREKAIGDVTAVYSVWAFTPAERAWIAKGHANLVIGIVGMEPIPPISIALRDGPAFEAVPEDDPRADHVPTEEPR